MLTLLLCYKFLFRKLLLSHCFSISFCYVYIICYAGINLVVVVVVELSALSGNLYERA